MAESGLSKAFRDLRKEGWECEFKTDKEDSEKKYLFQSRKEWQRYRKTGTTWLKHSGFEEDSKKAIEVLNSYCSKVVLDVDKTRIWVEK